VFISFAINFCDTLFLLASGDLGQGWKRVSLQQVLQCSYSLTLLG